MKIEEPRQKLLSNFEVYGHLVDIQATNHWDFTKSTKNHQKQKHRNNTLANLESITKDTFTYLSKNGCIPDREIVFKPRRNNRKGGDNEQQKITEVTETPGEVEFVRAMVELNKFELEKIEKLQIVNRVPRNLVALYAIVEECDQRFSEDQCNSILEILNTHFPPKETEENEEGGQEEEIQEEEGEPQENSMMDVDNDEGLVDDEDDLEGETFTRKGNEGELDE